MYKRHGPPVLWFGVHDEMQGWFINRLKGHSHGTSMGGLDFAEMSATMYEVEVMWRRGQRSRPFKNLIPRNHRNHVLACNYCRCLRSVKMQGRGPWRQREDRIARRFVLRFQELQCRHILDLPVDVLADVALTKDLIKKGKWQARLALLRHNVYPFETDGLNVEAGDLVHCVLCEYSLLVESLRPDGRLEAIREIDFGMDGAALFQRLRRAFKGGKLEKAQQAEYDDRYRWSFPKDALATRRGDSCR